MNLIKNSLYNKHSIQHSSKFSRLASKFQLLQVTTIRKKSLKPLLEIFDKVSVIIGGTTDVGVATANELLISNVKHVFLTGKDENQAKDALKELDSKFATKTTFVKLDHLNVEEYENLFQQTLKYGGTDILVNCNEIIRDNVWDYEINYNLKGIIQSNLQALKHMTIPNKENGVIVNLASTLGLDGFPFTPVYAGTKAGIIGFTRSIGHPDIYKDTKLRAVALCSGVTSNKELENVKLNQLNEKLGDKAQEYLNRMPKQTPSDVAKAIEFCAEYGQTGSVWVVEGAHILEVLTFDRQVMSEEVVASLD